MFGQQTNVIGRSCVVDKSINSTSTPSGNFLFEHYEFNFIGEITLTENCPQNGSIVSQHWTFNSTATIILPLVCSLNSTRINCGSVSLHSSQTEEIKLEQHCMQVIIKENFEETKVQLNETSFIRSSDPVKIVKKSPIITFMESNKWIIIGLGLVIVSLVTFITTYKLCKNNGHSDGRVSIKIDNAANASNTSPTCPATTMAHTGTNPIEQHSDQAKPSSESAPPS